MSKPSTTPATAAISAHGPARLLGPLLLLTLAALPATWWLPLFVARVPFLWREQVTVVSGLAALWDLDRFLFAIVLLCSVIAPITKLVATLHVWYRAPLGTAAKALGRLALLGKLSMAELFLLAVVIVGFKGVGVGRIEVAWGLEAFAAVVVLSFALSLWAEAAVRRLARQTGCRLAQGSSVGATPSPRPAGGPSGAGPLPASRPPSGSGGRRSASVTWASTETAISAGLTAPIGKPAGPRIRARAASAAPCSRSLSRRFACVRLEPRAPRRTPRSRSRPAAPGRRASGRGSG